MSSGLCEQSVYTGDMGKNEFGVCFECGAPMELRGGEGRTFTYRRGLSFVLPADFLTHTCTSCGADFMDDDMEREAEALYRQAVDARIPTLQESLIHIDAHWSSVMEALAK